MKKTITNYSGLEYVHIQLKNKTISQKSLKKCELLIAKLIIASRPLRGKEIKFLRKILGLSLSKLIVEMRGMVDQSTVSRWEKREGDRLTPANESLMRCFFAEKFKVSLKATPLTLVPIENNEIIELEAA